MRSSTQVGCLLLVCLAGWSLAASALVAPAAPRPADYDIRLDPASRAVLGQHREAAGVAAAGNVTAARTAAADALRIAIPAVVLSESPSSPLPAGIAPPLAEGRFLTAPTSARPLEVLRGFIGRYPALYGIAEPDIAMLEVAADYTNPDGVLSWVTLTQSIDGVPVFMSEVSAGFTRRGEMLRTVGHFAGEFDKAALPAMWTDPAIAVSNAAQSLGYAPLVPVRASQSANVHTFVQGPFADAITAERMYFPEAPGVLRPAWRVLLWEPAEAWYLIVDAIDGTVLWRNSLTAHQSQPATYQVYSDQSPTPGPTPPAGPAAPFNPLTSRSTVTPSIPTFDNLGWITDGNNTTDGNNVEAGVDRVAPNGVDTSVNGSPARVFNASYNPFPGNPAPGDDPLLSTSQRGATINAFYWANVFHDRTYQLGFTEAARNHQNDNFGRGGAGSDRLSVELQDSSGSNNANSTIAADGTRGRLQLFIWTATTPDSDGALDQDVTLHEITHTMTRRIVGNGSGFSGDGGGVDEGWADCMALFLQWKAADPLNGVYAVGEYATREAAAGTVYYGIRRFPYARMSVLGGPSSRPHNPLTFADMDPAQISIADGAFDPGPIGIAGAANAVHHIGEIWCSALFEVHANLVTRDGFTTGNGRMLQAMVDGMKLSPIPTTVLGARDAFLAALNASSAADVPAAWSGFARRGLGVDASQSGTAVVESFRAPGLVQSPALTFTDLACNANGYADPGERLRLSVPFTNPTDDPITASVQLGSTPPVSYGTIALGASATRQFDFRVPVSQACGSNLPVTFNLTENGNSGALTSALAIGSPPVTALAEAFDGTAVGSLPSGWGTTTTPTGSFWSVSTTSPVSAPNAVRVTTPNSIADSMLTVPAFAAGQAPTSLKFVHNYNFENTFDGGVLEVSLGGGAYVDILAAGGQFVSGGYAVSPLVSSGCTATPSPIAGRRAWTGVASGVSTEVILPAAGPGQTLQLRFRAASDCSVASTGWSVDNVEIGRAVCAVTACAAELFRDSFEN